MQTDLEKLKTLLMFKKMLYCISKTKNFINLRVPGYIEADFYLNGKLIFATKEI